MQASALGEDDFFSSVPFVVTAVQEGDQPPAPEEMESCRRREEERRRRLAEDAVPLTGSSPGNVFCFDFSLSTGEIDEPGLGPKRLAALQELCSVLSADVSVELEDRISAGQESLERFLSRAASEPVQVWTSSQPDEACGLCWLMAQMEAAGLRDPKVIMVDLPHWEDRMDGSAVQCSSWGEIEPLEWGRLAMRGEVLSPVRISALAARWRTLQEENSPLRAMVNGRLVSVPADFYDHIILRALGRQPEEFPEADLIADILSRCRPGAGDAWLALRIDALISRGLLVPVPGEGSRAPLYRRTLRKTGGCRI